jgi:hypothetical protein
MYNPPKTLGDLKALAASSAEDFETVFADLHHFSKHPPFRSEPTGFEKFVAYCESLTKGILPAQENEQTIQRAYRFLELRRAGTSVAESKLQAWAAFPLVQTK